MKITLVTGNPGKLREIQALALGNFEFEARDIDLPEVQSLDLREIVEDKVQRAYEIVKGPVIVEDISAGLDDLADLPGPFFKFFHKKLGSEILVKLAKISSEKITIQCTTAFYDGQKILFGEGILHGKVVEPRGENGFGFDPVVIPEGETRTMAEMTLEEKNKISHRRQAYQSLLKQL